MRVCGKVFRATNWVTKFEKKMKDNRPPPPPPLMKYVRTRALFTWPATWLLQRGYFVGYILLKKYVRIRFLFSTADGFTNEIAFRVGKK